MGLVGYWYTFRRDQFDKVIREDADFAAQLALQPAFVGQLATEYGDQFALAQLQLIVVGGRVRKQHLAQFAHYEVYTGNTCWFCISRLGSVC